MHKKLTIGLFGFGVVGEGIYQVLLQTPSLQAAIKKVCIKHPDKKRNAPLSLFTTDYNDILNDPEINLVVELIDDARPPPGAHRAAELVGLARRKAGRHDRELHRLFLEQGDAERSVKNRLDLLIRVIGNFLPTAAAAEVGMHHVSLNRPGSDDGHFNRQLVEILCPQPREHAHLSPAFDLKDADRIGAADHLVNARVFGGDRGERQLW